ncbi:hypothetical protein Ancab_014543, partial [Ancistrocladus abbreviatus]
RVPLNSSVEQMPSCCSRPVNIASEMGQEFEYDYNRKDIGSRDKGIMDKRDTKKADRPRVIPLNNVDSSSLLGVKFSHKGKHFARPHERNRLSMATGFPPNSDEEQMPSYCSRQGNIVGREFEYQSANNSKETGSRDAIPLNIADCYCNRCVNIVI